MWKKSPIILPLVILLTAALPFILCLVFQFALLGNRWKMEERLEEAGLQNLVLRTDQFQWTDEEKEITVQGHMFDVKNYFKQGQDIVFTGLFDFQEEALKLKAEEMASRQHDQNNSQAIFWTNLITGLQCHEIPSLTEHMETESGLIFQFAYFSESPISVTIPYPAPPPKANSLL